MEDFPCPGNRIRGEERVVVFCFVSGWLQFICYCEAQYFEMGFPYLFIIRRSSM